MKNPFQSWCLQSRKYEALNSIAAPAPIIVHAASIGFKPSHNTDTVSSISCSGAAFQPPPSLELLPEC